MINLNPFLRYRNILIPLADVICIIIGYIFTFYLIIDAELFFSPELQLSIVLSIIIYQIVFRLTGRYNTIIRYETEQDYITYILLCFISSILVSLSGELLFHFSEVSVKQSVGSGLIIGVLIVTYHLTIRYSFMSNMSGSNDNSNNEKQKNLLIIGGGYAANDIITTIRSTLKGKYNIVGIIDDNHARSGYYVSRIKILGDRHDIIKICELYDVDLIFFSIVNIDNQNKKEILNICRKTNAKVKILPGLRELIIEKDLYNTLRDVEAKDLLGREPVQLDNNNIHSLIKNKVVLVTGGGGSIGEELCKQIMLYEPKQLLMLDIYENNLYNIELELKDKYPTRDIKAIIATIRDENRLKAIFKEYSPEIVFHAAAHKHVPLMENNPTEAIKNNVFGTYNLVKVCDEFKTKRFILISTDKAVNPTNIMGASKRLCEMIIQAKNKESETEFVAVRFGNVLGSNGSVIPLFKKQISEGGPVTVTHKDITRFFMTIPEAVSLVLQAVTYAEGGEIFVLDMGKPVKIYDLAKSLIELSGLKLGEDINIKITGLRPGEKLYEELLMAEENLEKTKHEKIFITEPMNFTSQDIEDKLDLFRNLLKNESVSKKEIKKTMEQCVPTYKDPEK